MHIAKLTQESSGR